MLIQDQVTVFQWLLYIKYGGLSLAHWVTLQHYFGTTLLRSWRPLSQTDHSTSGHAPRLRWRKWLILKQPHPIIHWSSTVPINMQSSTTLFEKFVKFSIYFQVFSNNNLVRPDCCRVMRSVSYIAVPLAGWFKCIDPDSVRLISVTTGYRITAW
jgi:hypothetical protein